MSLRIGIYEAIVAAGVIGSAESTASDWICTTNRNETWMSDRFGVPYVTWIVGVSVSSSKDNNNATGNSVRDFQKQGVVNRSGAPTASDNIRILILNCGLKTSQRKIIPASIAVFHK